MNKIILFFLAAFGWCIVGAQPNMSDNHTPVIDPPGPKCNCRTISNGIKAGPLDLKFSAKPKTAAPDAAGFCYYAVDDAAVSLAFNGQINRDARFENKVKVSFGQHCSSQKLTAVSVAWQGNVSLTDLFIKIPGIPNQIKLFDLAVRKFSLTVDVNGNLGGDVTLRVTNTEDRDLTWNRKFVLLRKGTQSDISFRFGNTNGFAGEFDFSGVDKINIDLCKQDNKGKELILASFKDGSLDKDGTLTGEFSMEGDNTPSYTSNLFRITLLYLKLGLEMKIPDAAFRLTDGGGKVRIADMKHVTGTIDLGLLFRNNGQCEATVEASDVSAFSMRLNELKLTADFDENFDMTELRGKLKAKHEKFDAAIDVSEFLVKNGALELFNCAGSVKYSGFQFVLEGGSYKAAPQPMLNIAKSTVAIDATGTKADLTVKEFSVNEAGKIKVGSISGNLDRAPAKISFLAEFNDDGFYGEFNGELAKIGLNGALEIGAKPDYTFAYLKIEAKNDVGILIGQSGLKLTSLKGQVGYNYKLEIIDERGTPNKGSYILGLGVGISDIAGMCGVKGTTVVQFGNGELVVDLEGNVTVLKTNKFFEGLAAVRYKYPDQTLKGSIGAKLNIPSNGWMLKSDNLNINFAFGDKKFSADGKKMSGSMFFEKVKLANGYFNLGGDLTENVTSLKGGMGGDASAEIKYNMNAETWVADVSGNVNFSMTSDMKLNFDENGPTGSFDAEVNGSGAMRVVNRAMDRQVNGSASCRGSVSYNNNKLTLTGDLRVALPISVPVWNSNTWSFDWINEFSTGTVGIAF